nr:hypothetical protein [Micromonospora provocatoris]
MRETFDSLLSAPATMDVPSWATSAAAASSGGSSGEDHRRPTAVPHQAAPTSTSTSTRGPASPRTPK